MVVPLNQWSLAFWVPGTGFMEDNSSTDLEGGCIWDDSSAFYLLCTLFLLLLYQLYLRSTSGIRSQRLGTPDPSYSGCLWVHIHKSSIPLESVCKCMCMDTHAQIIVYMRMYCINNCGHQIQEHKCVYWQGYLHTITIQDPGRKQLAFKLVI